MNQQLKKKQSQQLAKKEITNFRSLIYSRHPSHSILRSDLPLLPFRSVVRLGSTTDCPDSITNGGRRVEINEIEGIRNSSDKLFMKRCFTQAEVKTADWWTINANKQFLHKEQEETPIANLPYSLIVKSRLGSRGVGNTLINSVDELQRFINNGDRNLSNYVVEKYMSYSREYRLHVTEDGCFYTCRKMLKNDTPKELRFQRHDDNCNWIVEENSLFDKPVNWNSIVADCVKAMKSLGLDCCAFDIKVQSAKNKKDGARENPEWILIESCSAPSFGTITARKYIEMLPKLLTKKAKIYGIIK